MKKSTLILSWPIFLCISLVLFISGGCQRELKTPTLNVPRGISGLELGMTPEQAGQLFTIKEDDDPVARLLTKYGMSEKGKVTAQRNKSLQKKFFRISSGVGKLPEGVTSADANSIHGVIYQIGLHHDETNVKKLGWQGITYPYIAKHGKPMKDNGSGYIWEDSRTRLDIESSGSVINVFYTDKDLEFEVKKLERENP
jgi:hypothetical protein